MNKNIILILVLIVIGGAIYYLQSIRTSEVIQPGNADIPIEQTVETSNTDTGAPVAPTVLQQEEITRIEGKSKKYQRAKELVSPDGYINVDSITVAENIGKKVIMIDFWTYSCINCQRTLPYLNTWYSKYEDEGLLIIGVHAPEFDFEKEYDNVKIAVEKFDIPYPVVLDNEHQTWKAYKNRYWPRKYLIDIDGFIVYDHIGEGSYSETEKKIQELLDERKEVLHLNTMVDKSIFTANVTQVSSGKTPEIYFGYAYTRDQLGNSEGWQPEETVHYKISSPLKADQFYLEGGWKNNPDNMELVSSSGKIVLNYSGKDVHIVAGSSGTGLISVKIDGKPTQTVPVSTFQLYNLAHSDIFGTHILELDITTGVMAYTFTFG